MKGKNFILIALGFTFLATLVYFGEQHLEQKRREVGMELDFMVSLMDYSCSQSKMRCIAMKYNPETDSPSIEEIKELSKLMTDSCFTYMFKHYSEEEVVDVSSKMSKVPFKSKDDMMAYYTNVLAADGIKTVTDQIIYHSIIGE